MRKLNGITINGEYLGNSVAINGMFRAICTISPEIIRDFVLMLNQVEDLKEAVKINNFHCGYDSIDIEFENNESKGSANLSFKIKDGEPVLTNSILNYNGDEYKCSNGKIVEKTVKSKSHVPIKSKNTGETAKQRKIRELKEKKLEELRRKRKLKSMSEELESLSNEEIKDLAEIQGITPEEFIEMKKQEIEQYSATLEKFNNSSEAEKHELTNEDITNEVVNNDDINNNDINNNDIFVPIQNDSNSDILNQAVEEELPLSTNDEHSDTDYSASKNEDDTKSDDVSSDESDTELDNESDTESDNESDNEFDNDADNESDIKSDNKSGNESDIKSGNKPVIKKIVDEELDEELDDEEELSAEELAQIDAEVEAELAAEFQDNVPEDILNNAHDKKISRLKSESKKISDNLEDYFDEEELKSAKLETQDGKCYTIIAKSIRLEIAGADNLPNDIQNQISSDNFSNNSWNNNSTQNFQVNNFNNQNAPQDFSQQSFENQNFANQNFANQNFNSGTQQWSNQNYGMSPQQSWNNPNMQQGLPPQQQDLLQDQQGGQYPQMPYPQMPYSGMPYPGMPYPGMPYSQGLPPDGQSPKGQYPQGQYPYPYPPLYPYPPMQDGGFGYPFGFMQQSSGESLADALQAKMDAFLAAAQAAQAAAPPKMTLDEFKVKQKQINDVKEKKLRQKFRIVGSREHINASALDGGVYVSGNKVYKWGDTRTLDD